MSTEVEKDKIISRVKKMLALAGDAGATEGERDNALRMAHATLAKHNLSLAEAVAEGGKDEDRKETAFFADGGPWARRCADAVGGLLFCYYVFIPRRALGQGGKITHFYIGKESNVVTAIELSKFVIDSILKESYRWAKARGAGSRERWSFAKGASEQVEYRCSQLRREAEKAGEPKAAMSTGTAVVLASLYRQEAEANEAWFLESRGGKPAKEVKSKERRADYEALLAGADFGQTISLQKQVNGQPQQKIGEES